jgi:hypothetical protein
MSRTASTSHIGLRAVLSCLAIATLAGCGPREFTCYPVTGKVTVKGLPAAGAVIVFHPQGGSESLQKLRPHATVQRDGSFELTCYRPRDGAPAGDYKVAVVWEVAELPPGAVASDDPESMPEAPDRLGGLYQSPEISKLKATVQPGSNQLEPFAL